MGTSAAVEWSGVFDAKPASSAVGDLGSGDDLNLFKKLSKIAALVPVKHCPT
jgi:hypothetical protein